MWTVVRGSGANAYKGRSSARTDRGLSQSAAGRTWSDGHSIDKNFGELVSAAG